MNNFYKLKFNNNKTHSFDINYINVHSLVVIVNNKFCWVWKLIPIQKFKYVK